MFSGPAHLSVLSTVLACAVSLLLGPQQVAGQLTVIWTPAPVQTNTWTWTAPSLTPTGDVSVSRQQSLLHRHQRSCQMVHLCLVGQQLFRCTAIELTADFP